MKLSLPSVVVALSLGLGGAAFAGQRRAPDVRPAFHPALALKIADGFVSPPQDADAPPFSEESVQATVDLLLRQRFEAAGGAATGFITPQAAKDTGWGVIADHFAEIDRNGDARASLEEVTDFFDARSPLPTRSARAARARAARPHILE
ncbi:MAG: hypothetical protein ACRECY_07700 [Phyllobacterium sp.]